MRVPEMGVEAVGASLQRRREFTALAETLIGLGPFAQAISTVTGLVLVAALWASVDATVLVSWYAALVTTVLWRAWIIAKRRRLDRGSEIPRSTIRAYRLGVVASGFVWGLTPVLLLPEMNPGALAIVAMMLAGITAGAVTVVSALPRTFTLFALPALLPFVILTLLRGNWESMVFGLLGLFFLIMMHKVSHDLYQVLRGNVRLSLQLRRERDLAFTTVQALAEGVVRLLPDGRVSYINVAAANILGMDPDASLEGEAFGELFPVVLPSGTSSWEVIRRQVVENRLPLDLREDLWFSRKPEGDPDGRWLRLVARPLLDEHEQLTEVIVVLRDCTLERTLFDRLEHHARHDPLTGLANRRALDDGLRRAVEAARRHDTVSILVFLDLDGFKQVNDRAGHVFGDRMLVAIAREMKQDLRADDLLCRIGGDEFTLLLRDCTLDDARAVAEKLADRVGRLVLQQDQARFAVGLSFGLARVDGQSAPQDIMLCADQACYAAKERKRAHGSIRERPG
ncbi:MAG: sensor domain-containing diguanylate cyclase [Wenzhouxiangellaceae bacterium]|nr:sensor domain-containing diguanylate cyclase [Wenzhouxiangellaceae bacterium]